MQKLKLGLKSYRYFDQAKELADKLGVVLNESILDAHGYRTATTSWKVRH